MQVGNGLSILQGLYALKRTDESLVDSIKHPFFEEEIKKVESKKDSTQNIDSKDFEKSEETDSITDKESLNGEKLDQEELQVVRELESIDRNVRAHEGAHIAAGAGVVTGGASFPYTRAPDAKMYATAGEVPIAMKEGRTPEETIQNARQIVAAAMAPSDPSPQDYKVAASAAQMESRARSEQAQEKAKEAEETLEKQEKSKEKDSIAQKESNDTQSTQKSQRDFDDSKSKDLSLRNYAIQSYKANSKSSSLMFEIAS